MRNLIVAIALVAVCPAAAQQISDDRTAVRAAFDAIQRAVERRDLATLEASIHPAFEMQHGLGQSDSRATWLALVAGGRLSRQTSQRQEFDPDIAIVGDTGIIRALVRLRNLDERRDTWMRATAVFVRQDGQWMQLNQQSSLLYEGAVADLKNGLDYEGRYKIEGRASFLIESKADYLALRWENGAQLPLFRMGQDVFAAGPGSMVEFTRNGSGAVTGAVRKGSDGQLWWSATRAVASQK